MKECRHPSSVQLPRPRRVALFEFGDAATDGLRRGGVGLGLGDAICDGVNVAGDGLAAHEQSLKGRSAPPAERVQYDGIPFRQTVDPGLDERLREHGEVWTKGVESVSHGVVPLIFLR